MDDDKELLGEVKYAIQSCKRAQSADRTPRDRQLAICITELEGVYARLKTFVVDMDYKESPE